MTEESTSALDAAYQRDSGAYQPTVRARKLCIKYLRIDGNVLPWGSKREDDASYSK